jgi:K+-sensing histidine kinase KdpD
MDSKIMPASAPAEPVAGGWQRQRAASILIGAAAHDLRTPLNTMAGWLQVLQSAPDLSEATRERAFKGLQSAVAQQAALAEGLAQIGAIYADGAALEMGSVEVPVFLEMAHKALHGEAQAKGVTMGIAGHAAVALTSDSALVNALLRQCLTGALKFAAKNSELTTTVTADPTHCRIEIAIARSLLPAAGIAAILRYTGGADCDKPSGAGAAFSFGVAQELARVLGGELCATAGASAEAVSLLITLPLVAPAR